MNYTRFLRILTACVAFSLSSCAPRGENKSVDQVLSIQNTRYNTAKGSANVDAQVGDLLSKVEAKLKIMADGDVKELNIISDTSVLLNQLIEKAAFTTRPALNEIIVQYRALSGSQVSNAQMKLLAARTYSVLSSELETTKFSFVS